MKVSKFKEISNLEEWKALVSRRIESKLSVSEWCKQNNMSKQQYYYRLRKVREMAIDSIETQCVSLVRYSIDQEKGNSISEKSKADEPNKIIVRYGVAVLELPKTTEINTIAMLMKALAQ